MRKLFQRHNTLSSSQGSEDSPSMSLAQISKTGNRIPQQQSSSKKNFGPRSIEGRGRSRTSMYAAPRGGSPYPQSPPPPPTSLPNSAETKGTQYGETVSEDHSKDTGQADPEQLQLQGQAQSEGHLESHELRQLVSRGAGPEGSMEHSVLPHEVFGLWCDLCNRRLVELKRQALRLWMPFASSRGTTTIKVRHFLNFKQVNSLQRLLFQTEMFKLACFIFLVAPAAEQSDLSSDCSVCLAGWLVVCLFVDRELNMNF